MSRRRRPKLGPDDGLHPGDIRDLNVAFYRMRPWAYFQRQIELLALMSDRPDALDDLLREGVSLGTTPLKLVENERVPDGERDEDRDRFLIAQIEVVLHHAVETLLRLYLAHESLSPCPWLAMTAARSAGEFKRAVRALADDLGGGRGRRNLMRVFFASNDLADFTTEPAISQELWEARLRNVSEWLCWYGSYFLDANVYNAAKHGFALHADHSSVQLGTNRNLDPLQRDGPSLLYIEEIRASDGPQWTRTIKWISFDTNARAVFMACKLMKAIMVMGAAARSGILPSSLDRLDKPEVNDVVNVDMPRSGITLGTARIGMVYLRNRKPGLGRPSGM